MFPPGQISLRACEREGERREIRRERERVGEREV
jgi:hypothetical protein